VKIKLDENLPARLVPALTTLGHDVDTVYAERLTGRGDPQVWSAAQAAQRFLITQDLDFGVVVNAHFALAVVEAMQSADVLRDRPPPRDRQRQKQCVEARIIESFTDVFTGGQDRAPFVQRDRGKPFCRRLPLLLAHPTSQHDDASDARG
jgi:Domain of unknown function (DUF5615)